MTDRIREPWGTRTPFGRDGEWPVRVDQHLEDGVVENDVDTLNVLKEELPEERESRFWAFVLGSATYAILPIAAF